MLVKLCDQPVDLLIRPIVYPIGFRQVWKGAFHRSSLCNGSLFYAMAVIRRKNGESCLESLNIKEGDGKGADATAGTSELTGNFTQQGGVGPLEPVIGLFV